MQKNSTEQLNGEIQLLANESSNVRTMIYRAVESTETMTELIQLIEAALRDSGEGIAETHRVGNQLRENADDMRSRMSTLLSCSST